MRHAPRRQETKSHRRRSLGSDDFGGSGGYSLSGVSQRTDRRICGGANERYLLVYIGIRRIQQFSSCPMRRRTAPLKLSFRRPEPLTASKAVLYGHPDTGVLASKYAMSCILACC